jgi:hypothetical protein
MVPVVQPDGDNLAGAVNGKLQIAHAPFNPGV